MAAFSNRFRTALVTGVSGGLGAAFAEMLLGQGVVVWGTARNLDRLAAFQGRPGFRAVVLDLGNQRSLEEAYAAVAEESGHGIDLVINNAGYGVFGRFADEPFDGWKQQVDAALTGTARLAHLSLRDMIGRGRGCLVNVSSVAVEYPLPFMSGYNVVKAGLSALSESLIFETRGTGVTVIDFRPGDYRTSFNHSMQATSAAQRPGASTRLARSWKVLEANLAAAPHPSKAAADLRRAIERGRSGTVYSGSFFQAILAPLFSRLAPAGLRRAVAVRYFGAD